MKPNFLVIGAQKAGTTWLYFYFKEHGEIFVPNKVKETRYFDEKEVYKKIAFSEYLDYFDGAGAFKAVGEVTPGYLWVSSEYPGWHAIQKFREDTPLRVLDKLGNATKFIVILRNPMDRVISAFQHHWKLGEIPECARLGEVWRTQGIVHMGFYAAHLKAWVKYFDPKQFHVTTYEEMFSDQTEVAKICHFLGVEYIDSEINNSKVIHPGPGFVRTDQGYFTPQGKQIATREDIAFLRGLYSEDVGLLSNEWFGGKVLWGGEFSEN